MRERKMEFVIKGCEKETTFSIIKEEKDGIVTAHFKGTFPNVIPKKVTVSFSLDPSGAYSTWGPSLQHGRQIGPDWLKQRSESRYGAWLPIHQLISRCGNNIACISVSDPKTPITILSGLREEDALIHVDIEFFTIPTSPRSEYFCDIFIDLRDIPFYDAIQDGVKRIEEASDTGSCYVPDAALLPMDSLWYSFHQELSFDAILKECALAKEFGMETVIIDDGWQTEDSSRGYSFCGDWMPAYPKVGDMKSLVDGIHELGMKVILWYAVPFVGIHSSNYKKFEKMLLDGTGDGHTFFSLDPRYREVRKHLVSVYSNAAENWGIDGFKLDFIDSFFLSGASLEEDPNRDIGSLEDALATLFSEIKAALLKIDPNVMIEFRQTYIGPCLRKIGNMLRVSDCPADAIKNRSNIIDMRLTSGGTPVHSDMLMWNTDSSPEIAALQIASSMFSVPQISVKLDKLPKEHRKMLSFYLDLWKKYRDVLMHGKISAFSPESNYTLARARKDTEDVTVMYEAVPIEVEKLHTVLINASGAKKAIIESPFPVKVKTMDCMGNVLFDGEVSDNLFLQPVPMAGIIFIDKSV